MSFKNYSKYGSRKVTYEGMTFDSKKEYLRYRELLLMEMAGKIHNLKRQVKFELIPAQFEPPPEGKKKQGKCIERACNYIADFQYMVQLDSGQYELVVEDTKGFKTPEYIIKRKLMLHKYGIRIKEI